MEEKKIESREIQVPFKKQTILGFTDQKRESLRVGITQKKFELNENEITLSSLGMRGDGKWALDGKTRKVSRKEILCILRPEIENKQFIFSEDLNKRNLVVVSITKKMVKFVRKSKKKMIKMEKNGFVYGVSKEKTSKKISETEKAKKNESKKEKRKLKKLMLSQIQYPDELHEQEDSPLKKHTNKTSLPASIKNQVAIQEEQSTMLRKRSFHHDFASNKQKSKISRIDQMKKLPSFLRTATTNLRFDSSKRISASQETDNPRNMAKYLLHDKHRILKSFSQDMTSMIQDIICENKRMMFLQGIKQIVINFNSSIIARKTDVIEIDQGVLNSTYYGTIPNEEEMNLIIEYFRKMEQLVLKANKGEEDQEEVEKAGEMSVVTFEEKDKSVNLFYNMDVFYYYGISKIIQVLVKFMLTREKHFLHKLKRKLYFDEFSDIDDHFAYSAFMSLENIATRVLSLFSNNQKYEYYSIFKDSSLLIIRNFRKCFDEIMLVMKLREENHIKAPPSDELISKITLMKESVAFDIFVSYLQKLMKSEDCMTLLLKQVYFGIFRMINLKNNFVLSRDQPKLITRVNKIFENRMNCTQRIWNNLVDFFTDFIKEERQALILAISARPKILNSSIKKLFSSSGGLQKALSMALVRNYLGKHLPDLMENGSIDASVNDFLQNLYESEDKLPILVFLVQSLIEKHGGIDSLKDGKVAAVDLFIRKHLSIDAEQEVEQCKIIVNEYEKYLELKNKIVFMVDNDQVDEMLELLGEITAKKVEDVDKKKKKKRTKKVKKKKKTEDAQKSKERKLNRYLFFMALLNESYLMRASIHDGMDEYVESIQDFFLRHQDTLALVTTEAEINLIISIVTNFEGYKQLKMKTDFKQRDLSVRILMAHAFVFFITTDNDVLKSSEEDNEYCQRLQLAYLAGDDNSKYEAMAPIILSKTTGTNWLVTDATSLNRCNCGFFYFIGNCGQAMQSTTCPSCGGDIGGQNHALNTGNRQSTTGEFMKAYSKYEKENMQYEFRDLDKVKKKKDYMPIRGLNSAISFKVADLLNHLRYLFDYVSCEKDAKKRMNEYIGMSEKESVKYLFEVSEGYYRAIKADLKTYTNSFQCLNILIEESCLDLVLKTETRNTIECDLGENYKAFKRDYKRIMSERMYLKEIFKDSIRTTRNIVADWVNKLTNISEFGKMGIDLKIVTGLRIMSSSPTLEGLQEQIQGIIRKKASKINTDGDNKEEVLEIKSSIEEQREKDELKKCEFLQFVFRTKDILTKFPRLLYTHIDFVNYLQKKFDYRVSYQLACAVSIGDLITSNKSQKKILNLDKEMTEDEENLEIQKFRLIEKHGEDVILEKKFYDMIEVWEFIMEVRDNYPEIFDFRFLCHANDLPEDKIKEIMSLETAKLIYFLPNEKYVESLFISSALQTLSKFQNLVIKSYLKYFINVNYRKPKNLAVQKINYKELISIDTDVEELIRASSYRNPKFNKETEFIFDLDFLTNKISKELFGDKNYLLFEGDYIKHFNFAGSFNEVSNFISTVCMNYPQKDLSKFSFKQMIKICIKEPEQVFAIFARKIAELKRNLKSMDNKTKIMFDKEKKQDEDDDAHLILLKGINRKSNVIASLNSVKITLNTIREAYELIEEHIYEYGVDNLDVVFKEDLDDENLKRLKKAAKTVDEEELDVIVRVCKSMLLRQLVGSTRQALADMSVKMCIEWSDALHEDEQIKDEFLEALGDGIQMRHLYSMINNL